MIFTLFAVFMFVAQYFLARWEKEYTDILRFLLIGVALVFLAYDTFYYVIVPSEIAAFYNNGAGLNVGNTTIFNSTDMHVIYYNGWIANDYQYMELARTIALFFLVIVGVVYAADWISKHNLLGEKVYGQDKEEGIR